MSWDRHSKLQLMKEKNTLFATNTNLKTTNEALEARLALLVGHITKVGLEYDVVGTPE